MVTRACLRYAQEGQNVAQAGPKCHTSRVKMSHKGQNVTQSCYNTYPCLRYLLLAPNPSFMQKNFFFTYCYRLSPSYEIPYALCLDSAPVPSKYINYACIPMVSLDNQKESRLRLWHINVVPNTRSNNYCFRENWIDGLGYHLYEVNVARKIIRKFLSTLLILPTNYHLKLYSWKLSTVDGASVYSAAPTLPGETVRKTEYSCRLCLAEIMKMWCKGYPWQQVQFNIKKVWWQKHPTEVYTCSNS